MIEKQNFRYRGPVESHKLNQMMQRITPQVNDVIAKTKALVDNTETISKQLIADTKRRGTI